MYGRFQGIDQPPCTVRKRRGVMLLEVVIAAIILSTAMALLVPGLAASARQREQRRFEVLSRLELGNLRVVAESRGTSATAGQLSLSGWFQRQYPDAVLQVESVATNSDSWPCGDGLRFSITRPDAGSSSPVVISLICWPGADQ
jgi:type II secretory pathway pseudopilin PulG